MGGIINDRLARMLTTKPTLRVEQLRAAFLSTKLSVSIDRARIETRVMQETEGEPMFTRKAKVFQALVEEMPKEIVPGELIWGFPAGRPRCENIGPSEGPSVEASYGFSLSGPWSYELSDAAKRELTEKLIPYWKGRGNYEKTSGGRVCRDIPPDLASQYFADPDTFPPHPSNVYYAPGAVKSHHYGHNIVAYDKVLALGFLGIRQEAEKRLAEVDAADPDSVERTLFLRAVVQAMTAAAAIGSRYAERARELAGKEATSANKKKELLQIAQVCDRVPAYPARTFHEALQAYYFTWMLILWETPFINGQSPGRADQYLYPYFERDLREGRITREEAQELLDCFILKFNHTFWLDSNLSVGGIKTDGSDATNELSYMLLEAMMHIRLTAPHIAVLVHGRTPDELLIKAVQLCALGTGHPMFFNNDVIVDQSLARGTTERTPISLEEARSTTIAGCIESVIPGKDCGPAYFSAGCNLAAMMEFVLTNGWSRHYKRKMGAETGDPRQFKSFPEVQEAFRRQMAHFARSNAIVGNLAEKATAEINPTVFESALLEDCLQLGKPKELGGARYNTASISPVGPADAADSLTAIRKFVFDDKKLTMGQLCDALDRNFEGCEHIHQMLLKAPKYGNDDDYADEQMAFVAHVVASELNKQKNTRGGRYICMGSPVSMYVSFGEVVGALPSGRKAGEPLADGWSPTSGNDLQGPTALLKSMSKVDNVALHSVLNIRMDPTLFDNREGVNRLAALIRTMVDQRVFEVQINVVSTKTLRAAQKEPDKYRDLIVKVAGYNAFFTDLNKAIQNSIIARKEHTL